MNRIKKIVLVALLVAFTVIPPLACEAQGKRKPVMVRGTTGIPLRVLARAGAEIYSVPEDGPDNISNANVPTFQAFFAYTRPDTSLVETTQKGWWEIGTDDQGNTVGWLKAEDAIPWKVPLVLAFREKANRKNLLMFKHLTELREIVMAKADARAAAAEELYAALERKEVPEKPVLLAMEPDMELDITKQFYLMPIIEHCRFTSDGNYGEAHLLKVAATVGDKAASEGGSVRHARKVKVDIVFVMDMTSGMGPFIEATLRTVKDLYAYITHYLQLVEKIRFGLWGYRDSMDNAGIEFVTKNFTGSELQTVQDFENTLAQAGPAEVGSKDYEEDVFSGMHKAITETPWTQGEGGPEGGQGALRFIILIGDAPSHEPGHPWNASGTSAETLAILAAERRIYTCAMHIKDPDYTEFWDKTESQFRELSRTEAAEGGAAYFGVDADDVNAFSAALYNIACSLVQLAKDAQKGNLTRPTGGTGGSGGRIDGISQTANMQFLGSKDGTAAPGDVIAWVSDRDLIDPWRISVEPRILMTKRELSELQTRLGDLFQALSDSEITGRNFFGAVPTHNPEDQADHLLLGLPELLRLLPYKSPVLSMTGDEWTAATGSERQDFIDTLLTKILWYRDTQDTAELWIELNPGDEPSEYVFPIPLDMLP